MAEVEAQPVGRVERAALGDVVAQRASQRLVQQVRRRMVGADRAPTRVIDLEHRAVADGDASRLDRGEVQEHPRRLLGVVDAGAARPGRSSAMLALSSSVRWSITRSRVDHGVAPERRLLPSARIDPGGR